jgi:HEAT repeat protein
MEPATEEKILDAQTRLYDSDPAESRRAAQELGAIGLLALPTLIAALDEPRAGRHVHQAALDAIERLGPAAHPALPQVLKFLNPEIAGDDCSLAAVGVVETIGDPALQPLLERLRDSNELECHYVRRAISGLRPRSRVNRELIGLLDVPNGDFRIRVCKTLLVSRDHETLEQAAPRIVQLLHETDSYVRAAAIEILALLGFAALNAIWPLTTSLDPAARMASLEAIAACAAYNRGLWQTELGNVFTLFAERLMFDSDASVRITAAMGLHQVAQAAAQMTLELEIIDEDLDSQLLATRSYLSPRLRPDFFANRTRERVLHAKDLRLRRLSAATLLACDEGDADGVLETLRSALLDPEDSSRDKYLVAAQRGGYWSAPLLPAIMQLLRPDDPLCRIAIETIAAIGLADEASHDESVARLIDCLQRAKDWYVRVTAARALGRLAPAGAEVVTALVEALQDSAVGEAACTALGQMRQAAAAAAAAVPAIEAAPHLGYCVAEALGRIRTPEAIAALWRPYDGWFQGGYGDHVGRTSGQDLFDRANAVLIELGEIEMTNYDPDGGQNDGETSTKHFSS